MGLRKKGLDKEWLEWLSDEVPPDSDELPKPQIEHKQDTTLARPEVARTRIRGEGVPEPISAQKSANNAPEHKNISINIHFKKPDLSGLVSRIKQMKPSRKQLKLGAAALVALVVVISGVKIAGNNTDQKGDVQSVSTEKPGFDTVLPNSKEEETSSGKLQYDPEKQVASFTDTIDLVNVTVSQQPLPEAFKKDPDGELKKLAEQISAKEVITNSSPRAYLGTSAKGPQTAVFIKNNLLIFIHSTRSIDKSGWAEYIIRLQ